MFDINTGVAVLLVRVGRLCYLISSDLGRFELSV
uniref:Uncharacterized protein n=1 Tax=Siphoviridae sp. ct7aK2 TaxID=2825351 RepID=A0A8S5U996_9CAUD|nr:MAG TPA: hypothetical protein [Siphoviridae sp. ct7aK2]